MMPVDSYELSPAAMRDLRKLDEASRRRVFTALDRLVASPREADVRKLIGRDEQWRLRVGSWRVIFRKVPGPTAIVVLNISQRRNAYRR